MLKRALNVGFSGGEKKRLEILQMALFEPQARASWTKPIPASTSTRCASSPKASTRLRSPERAMLVITHYQRLLDYIVPDTVHVLAKGRIVPKGGTELALELEKSGYADYVDEAA